jgi:hypothetical protein
LKAGRRTGSESMQSLMRGLMMALLVIYAMLAIPFNSFIQPGGDHAGLSPSVSWVR